MASNTRRKIRRAVEVWRQRAVKAWSGAVMRDERQGQGTRMRPASSMGSPSVSGAGVHDFPSFYDRHPYMDLIATSQHVPRSVGSTEQWKRTLVQPVVIPSLAHTGIRSIFDEYENSVMRPDGYVSREFKDCIHKELRELPQLPLWADTRDMKRRDRSHVCEKVTSRQVPFHVGGRSWKDRAALARSEARHLNAADSSSLSGGDSSSVHEPWNLGKRLVNPNKRLKKPYSRDSLVKSLIEFNFTPVDKPLEWEVKGVTYILNT